MVCVLKFEIFISEGVWQAKPWSLKHSYSNVYYQTELASHTLVSASDNWHAQKVWFVFIDAFLAMNRAYSGLNVVTAKEVQTTGCHMRVCQGLQV